MTSRAVWVLTAVSSAKSQLALLCWVLDLSPNRTDSKGASLRVSGEERTACLWASGSPFGCCSADCSELLSVFAISSQLQVFTNRETRSLAEATRLVTGVYQEGQRLWQYPGCSQPLTWWGRVGLAPPGSTQSLWLWPRGCSETPARATVTWTFPTWFLGREKGGRALPGPVF